MSRPVDRKARWGEYISLAAAGADLRAPEVDEPEDQAEGHQGHQEPKDHQDTLGKSIWVDDPMDQAEGCQGDQGPKDHHRVYE